MGKSSLPQCNACIQHFTDAPNILVFQILFVNVCLHMCRQLVCIKHDTITHLDVACSTGHLTITAQDYKESAQIMTQANVIKKKRKRKTIKTPISKQGTQVTKTGLSRLELGKRGLHLQKCYCKSLG